MKITKEKDSLHIVIDVPLEISGEDTYGDGRWIAPGVCIWIDEKHLDFALSHTQFLDYKDSLQATQPIVHFDTKEEAMEIAEKYNLPIEYARD